MSLNPGLDASTVQNIIGRWNNAQRKSRNLGLLFSNG